MSHGTSFQNIVPNSDELTPDLPSLISFPHENTNGVFAGTLYTRVTNIDCVN